MGIFSIMDSIFMSLIIIGGGFMCKSVANEKPNNGMGYRTKLSKKNLDTWKEANTYGGNMLIICGIVYFILSLTYSILFFNNNMTVIVVSIGMLPVLLIGILFSEKHLKNMFDNDGNRK
ncbi:MAG: SdpI family protein [Bacillota bacterium]|nr:SdpI family protein [Bacillota bacterium]